MNSVERVKALCKERKLPISRLEKDLGFANGYIGQLRKGTFPADRLQAIADYFGVTTDYLLGTDTKKEPLTVNGEELSDAEAELLELFRRVPEDQRDLVLGMIRVALGNR